MAERLVILSAKRERIRIPPEMERIATGLKPLAMTGRQFSVHPTVFAATKPLVILSARRERIRNSLKKRNGLPHALQRSRLPARSVLLLRRGVHRTPAPQ